MKTNDLGNFRYALYFNILPIIKYLVSQNLDINVLNMNDKTLIIYLVTKYKEGSIQTMIINNQKYMYISNPYIINDLYVWINVKEGQLKNMIKKLVKYNFIEIELIKNKYRYIKINNEFLELFQNDNSNKTPIEYLREFEPGKFEIIINEFQPYLIDFKELIERFETNFILSNEPYKTKKIFNMLRAYLNTCLKNKVNPDNKPETIQHVYMRPIS